jgi:ferric-dicitrate binding protein FerR (iron transport regulator)
MKKQRAVDARLRVPEVVMTGSSLSSPTETIGGPLRDEAALEQQFRTRFPALCSEAKSHLGEAAASAAPKIVEAAFRHAWDDREHITSEADLDAFLHDAIKHAAARELSRRAGARHLAGSASHAAHHAAQVADVDQAWAHLTRQIHPETVRAEAQAYKEQLRHHAAEHVGDLSKPRSWKVPVFLGIIAAALIGGAMWWLSQIGTDQIVTRALESTEARSLAAANGQTGNVTLDDSTRVTLAPGSKLTIPRQFPVEMRAVKIDGAARFTVVPGGSQPFEVRAGNAAVLATGTTIIVRAFPSDRYATIHLREGQATVRVGEAERALTAGQTVFVGEGNEVRDATPAEVAEATNWTNRRVTISRQLRDVVQEINRWYGVDIKVPEIKALDRSATVDAPLDSLRVAIAQVEKSAGVTFGYEGQTMVFKTPKPRADSVKK